MRVIGTMFADVAKDSYGRYWLFDRVNQFIGYAYKDFDMIYPVKKIDIGVGVKNFAAHNIYVSDGQVYVASHNSVCILGYDVNKKIFECYANKDAEMRMHYKTVRYGGEIFFLPLELKNRTYAFDIKTKTFSERRWLGSEDGQIGSFEFVFEKDGVAYLPLNETNSLLRLDMSDFTYQKLWFDKGVSLNSVFVSNDGIWATQDSSETIVYLANGVCEYYKLGEDTSIHRPFSNIFSTENEIIVLPRRVNYITLINRSSKRIRKIVVSDNILKERTSASLFLGYYIDGHQVTLFPWGQELICKLDCRLGELCGYDFKLNDKDYYNVLVKQSIYERHEKDLSEFCQFIKYIERELSVNEVKEQIGRKIYTAVNKSSQNDKD